MENASKALIIAGAIIISILIIGLGVFIYSGAADNVSTANLESEQAQAHNGKFNSYFGQKVTASQVKALMKEVITNNVTTDTSDELGYIYILFGTDYKTPKEVNDAVESGYTYQVNTANDTANDSDKDSTNAHTGGGAGYYRSGFIKTIAITKNSRSST